eukprot:14394451-Alexandrium_andersonii.AAC.1
MQAWHICGVIASCGRQWLVIIIPGPQGDEPQQERICNMCLHVGRHRRATVDISTAVIQQPSTRRQDRANAPASAPIASGSVRC